MFRSNILKSQILISNYVPSKTKSERNQIGIPNQNPQFIRQKPASEHDFVDIISQENISRQRERLKNRGRSAPPLQSSQILPNFPVSASNPSRNALPATDSDADTACSIRAIQPSVRGAILCENVPRGTQRIIKNQADSTPFRPIPPHPHIVLFFRF